MRIIFLLLVISTFNSQAQTFQDDEKSKRADSITIEKYIKQLNAEFEKEDYSSNVHYDSGRVHLSQDKKLKIFLLEGNGGGAYGNSMYISFIHFYHKGKQHSISMELVPIIQIIKLQSAGQPDSYFIIQESSGRAGMEFMHCYSANNILIDKDSIRNLPFIHFNLENTEHLWLCSSHFCSAEVKDHLFYDAKKNELSYQYCKVGQEEPTGIKISGSFKLKEGRFIETPAKRKEEVFSLEEETE